MGNVTLIDDDIVYVNEIETIHNISNIITQQSSRLLQNYMIWRFVVCRVQHMPKRFRTMLEKLEHIALGTKNQQSQINICANYVNENMGLAVSKLYTNKYYDKYARAEVLNIYIRMYLVLSLFFYYRL